MGLYYKLITVEPSSIFFAAGPEEPLMTQIEGGLCDQGHIFGFVPEANDR